MMLRGLVLPLLRLLLLLLTATATAGGGGAAAQLRAPVPVSPGQPVHAANPLASLPALPKVHHSTEMGVNASDPVLLHYARITHSLGLSVFWSSKEVVYEFARACRASDALQLAAAASAAPAIRCSIAANYNPWGEDSSPFPRTAPPTQQGALEAAELQLFRSRLANATAWLAEANRPSRAKSASRSLRRALSFFKNAPGQYRVILSLW